MQLVVNLHCPERQGHFTPQTAKHVAWALHYYANEWFQCNTPFSLDPPMRVYA